MGKISGKVNLQLLKSKMVEKDGKNYLIIGIESNHLIKGKKGVYLDLAAWEIKNKQTDSKDTHIVKQSLPKEVFEKMTDDQKKEMPIIGNLVDWDNVGGGSGYSEPTPVQDEEIDDDLPF